MRHDGVKAEQREIQRNFGEEMMNIAELTDEQKQEIDRRISAYEANPEDVMTWDEVKASLRVRVAEKSIRDSQRPDPPKSPLERGTLKSIPVPVPPFQGG
jgi:putative addiction module component (TIGR02574 family)